jgi:F-type H+-transporting ATPase subunit a
MMLEHQRLDDLAKIGDWATNHCKDTFELDLVWAKPELPSFFDLTIGSMSGRVGLSKYMLMELIAAALCLLVFIPLARRAHHAAPGVVRGKFWNFFEAILLFLRNTVARPAIGEHDADHFLPYLWTVFFFVLFNNLIGMVPFGGAATSSLETTAALALCSFLAVHGSGVKKMGVLGYLKSVVPPVPTVLWPLMFVVEIIGHLAKSFALCVRLFANIFGGHMAVTVLLGFIVLLANTQSALIYLVAPGSIVGVILFSLLDLFVAFLQAYIFTFLSAVFIGMAVHPHH